MNKVAEIIASKLQHGDVIGVGTGSTVAKVLGALGEYLKQQNKVVFALSTSTQSSQLCQHVGILPIDPAYAGQLVYGFDGADEVDSQLRAIKGKGAAMLREKIVASRCTEFSLVIDESKKVDVLGLKNAVPVEIIPIALDPVERHLKNLGATEIRLRDGAPGKHGPVVTEYGNLVLDTKFSAIPDSLEWDIKSIVGVVESGLFLNAATEVLIQMQSGEVKVLKK
jgi:ribose 5-phosphate isomerase A